MLSDDDVFGFEDEEENGDTHAVRDNPVITMESSGAGRGEMKMMKRVKYGIMDEMHLLNEKRVRDAWCSALEEDDIEDSDLDTYY